MLEIHRFPTCLAVLQAAFAAEQSDSSQVTLKVYAKALGISTSSFHMILAGKRNLTLRHVQRAGVVLKLSPTERDYFETLFLRDHADADDTRQHYEVRLKSLADAVHVRRVRRSDRSLLARWQLPVLLVYLWDVHGITGTEGIGPEDLATLAMRLDVPSSQLADWLECCRRAGLVEIAKDGRTHLVLDGIARQIPQKTYLRNVLSELAKRVEPQFDDPHHIFRAFTFSMDPDQTAALRAALVTLFERYMALHDSNHKANTVVTAFAGVFPGLLPQPGR